MQLLENELLECIVHFLYKYHSLDIFIVQALFDLHVSSMHTLYVHLFVIVLRLVWVMQKQFVSGLLMPDKQSTIVSEITFTFLANHHNKECAIF